MLSNYGWYLLNYFNPFMIFFIISTTMVLEYLLLNRYLKKPLSSVFLIVICNLGSFLVGLPLLNSQFFVGLPLFHTSFSFYYNLITSMSEAITSLNPKTLVQCLPLFAGLLFISTLIEFLIIKLYLRKTEPFSLQMSFQINLGSHLFLFSTFFVISILDVVSILPLENFFIEKNTFVDGNLSFLTFIPYILILSLIGILGTIIAVIHYLNSLNEGRLQMAIHE